MKKALTILFALFFSQILISQNSKEVIYVNSNNQQISQKELNLLKETKKYVFLQEVENDTLLLKRVFVRKNYGELDSLQHEQIKMFLAKIIGSNFDGGKDIMIHLYTQKGKNVQKDKKHEKYWKWIEKNKDDHQAYLFGTKDSGITPDKENHMYIDTYNLLHNLFFTKSPFKINHLYIKPNGEIYIYYGGEDILGILDWSV